MTTPLQHHPRELAAAAMLLGIDPDRLARAIKAAADPEPAATAPTVYLHPREAARRLSVCHQTVMRALRSGKLPGKRVGNQWRIPEAALAIHQAEG